MATQKVPLTRIDETGASEGKVLKYSSGALAWGEGGSSSGGGSGFAAKNQLLGTETESVCSRTQYNVFGSLELESGSTMTIAASGDLIIDAPDDPNKAAGWTNMGTHIATTNILDDVCIGTQTQLSTDDKLSVAGGNLTVAGSISAQSDVYGNNIPAGKYVVQIALSAFDVFSQGTQTTYHPVCSATISNVDANNTILGEFVFSTLIQGDADTTWDVVKGTENVTLDGRAHHQSQNGSGMSSADWHSQMIILPFRDDSPDAGSNTYTLRAKSTGSWYFCYSNTVDDDRTGTNYNSNSYVKIEEIKGALITDAVVSVWDYT